MNYEQILIFGLWHPKSDDRIFYKQAISLNKKLNVKCIWWVFSNKKGIWEEEWIENIWLKWNRLTTLVKAWWYWIKNKADIYVAHDLDSYLVIIGIKLFKWKSKIVFDVHEYYELLDKKNWLSLFQKLLIKFYKNLFKPLTIRLISWLTLVTEDMKKYFTKNIKKEVIYNFPIKKLFSNIQPNNKLDKSFSYLVYHWWISEDRGIWQMIKIIEKLNSNFKLLLIWWFFSKSLEEEVLNYIKNNNLKNKVIYTWKLPFKDTISYLKNPVKKIWLVLLENSGQMSKTIPIKMLEYLQLEIPQIWSNHINSFKQFIASNKCWIAVEYWNTEQAVNAILNIYNNYDKYVTQCKKIKNNYIWENEEKKLLNFYNEILNEK